MTLEGKQDQSRRSLPYIGLEALGSKPPNWNTTRSPTAEGVLRHKESYNRRSPAAQGVLWQ